jgi:hypothetical protein
MRANPATVPVAAVWRGGGCPACVGEIALARWLGRRGAIAIVNRTDGQTTCAIDRGALPARFHARETDGPVRARGFVRINPRRKTAIAHPSAGGLRQDQAGMRSRSAAFVSGGGICRRAAGRPALKDRRGPPTGVPGCLTFAPHGSEGCRNGSRLRASWQGR